MEVLLAYLLGLGTVAALAKRKDTARDAVAWTARHAGALSGRVAKSLEDAARVARDEYQRGREEQLEKPLADGPEVERVHQVATHHVTRFNGNRDGGP
jgi:hypothetical protein